MNDLNKPLEEGDEILCVKHAEIETLKVVRVTKTQAELSNKVKLKREPFYVDGEEVRFRAIEDYHDRNLFYRPTPELIKRHSETVEQHKAEIWFRRKEFTKSEQLEIYRLFMAKETTQHEEVN